MVGSNINFSAMVPITTLTTEKIFEGCNVLNISAGDHVTAHTGAAFYIMPSWSSEKFPFPLHWLKMIFFFKAYRCLAIERFMDATGVRRSRVHLTKRCIMHLSNMAGVMEPLRISQK